MVWWATICLTIAGFLLANGWGMVVGLLLGLYIDIHILSYGGLQSISYHHRFRGFRKYHFICVTFSVLGHMAKAHGFVTQQHLDYADALMTKMRLNASLRLLAKRKFNQGKMANFSLVASIVRLRDNCGQDDKLLEHFVEAQLEMARLNGKMPEKCRRILITICQLLQFGIMEEGGSAYYFHEKHERQDSSEKTQHNQWQPKQAANQAEYDLLGLTPGATHREIKSAYRRLISQYHPDRVIAAGGNEAAIAKATEKTQAIYQAYQKLITKC